MVEHDLAKVGVASSSLVSRSKSKNEERDASPFLRFRLSEAGVNKAPCCKAPMADSAVADGKFQCGHGYPIRHVVFELIVACLEVKLGHANVQAFD